MRTFSKALIYFAFSACTLMPTITNASGQWYFGVVSRLVVHRTDGSFFITLDSTALDDCQSKYAFFEASDLGDKRIDQAYSLALVSLTAGRRFGVVIDKTINGPGGKCDAKGGNSQTADLR